jgi:hypothetical protein
MPQEMPLHEDAAEADDCAEVDAGDEEVVHVLAELRGLLERVSNPVIRACLEDAADDIEHLTAA